MKKLMVSKRIGAGSYEIHTPYGTYLLNNCPADANQIAQGFRSGPRWMLTWPGEYSADADMFTKAEALAQIIDNVTWELDLLEVTPAELAIQRRNFHADNSPFLSKEI